MKFARSVSLIDVLERAEADSSVRRTYYTCVNCRSSEWASQAPTACKSCHSAIAFVPMGSVLPKGCVASCCE